MRGLLLNPLTGRPERNVSLRRVLDTARSHKGAMREGFESVYENLRLSGENAAAQQLSKLGQGPAHIGARNSLQTWEEMLYVTIADGAQVLNTTTETILVPDYTIPAGFMYQGRALKFTLFGNSSTVITTPGTITFRLRWGGVAGTQLVTSGAFAPDPTAASTTSSWMVQYYTVCRSIGTAGSMFTMGSINWSDFDDATVTTIVGNLNMGMAPVSAPAVVSSLDTTTAKALSPTVAHSVATATTQSICHMAFLEALT
jgi:hypothetical protein